MFLQLVYRFEYCVSLLFGNVYLDLHSFHFLIFIKMFFWVEVEMDLQAGGMRGSDGLMVFVWYLRAESCLLVWLFQVALNVNCDYVWGSIVD